MQTRTIFWVVAVIALSGFWSVSKSQEPYPSLPLTRNDFLVNSLDGTHGSDQFDISVALDSSGYFAVAWIDARNGVWQAFAQVFDPNGQRVGEAVLLDSTALDYDGYPIVAASGVGRFVVTWSTPQNKIYFQLLGLNGQKIGGKTLASQGWGRYNSPAVAMAPGGRFLLIWQNGHVFGRLYDANGRALSETLQINPIGTGAGYGGRGVSPVAADGRGHFAVAYSQISNGEKNIFLQFVDTTGAKIGDPVLVSDPQVNKSNSWPFVSATKDGVVFILWANGNGRIYRFGKGFVTEHFLLKKKLNWEGYCAFHSCSSNGRDRFFAAFQIDGVVRVVAIDTSGTLLNQDVAFSDEEEQSIGYRTVFLSGVAKGRLVAALVKYNDTDQDAILRMLGEDLTPLGSFFACTEDPSHGPQYNPAVVTNKDGQTLVVWVDRRAGRYDLYGQVYDANGQPVGENFCITPEKDLRYFGLLPFKVAAFEDGMFVIAYLRYTLSEHKTSCFKLFLRRINPDGSLNGPRKELVTFYNNWNVSLKLLTGEQDGLLFYWKLSEPIYYGAVITFNELFNFIPTPRHILPPDTLKAFRELWVCGDEQLNYLLLWQPYVNHDYHQPLMGQFFDQAGQAYGDKFTVLPEFYSPGTQIACRMRSPDEYAIAVYSSAGLRVLRYYRINDKPVVFKNHYHFNYFSYNFTLRVGIYKFENRKLLLLYKSSDTGINALYFNDNKNTVKMFNLFHFTFPTGITYFDRDLLDYSAAVSGDQLFFAYESNRHGGSDFDIWARIYALDGIDFSPEPYYDVRNLFDELILQNAPNPFSGTTRITYYLPTVERLKLTVYNVLGQKVAVLLDEVQDAGWHEAIFDASHLPSGIYFCRLEGFHQKTIAMIHVR